MKLNKFDLSFRNAVITGGAGLLGYQHASALIELNANIYLLDVNFKKMLEKKKELLRIFPEKKYIYTKLT